MTKRMSEPTEQTETQRATCARILGELSELGLTLTRDLHPRGVGSAAPPNSS
jgi:hypothetical protein